MTSTEASIAVVVTTLGRLEALEKLLRSLAPQLVPKDSLIIVAQEHFEDVSMLAGRLAISATVSVLTSDRGASRGRNTGVFSTEHGEILIFPNDTTWFPEGSIDSIRSCSTHDVLVYTVRDENGPKFLFEERVAELNYRSIWDVIEPGFAMRRDVFETIGGFDADIGTGASTPWQAGEVADLLYRWQRASTYPIVRWEPNIVVGGITDSVGLSTAERRRKLRAYGRGCGRIMTRYGAPIWFRLAYIVAGFFVALKRPGLYQLVDGWSAMLGRLEGVSGKIWGGSFSAVSK